MFVSFCCTSESAQVVTRRDQLGLTAAKKGKEAKPTEADDSKATDDEKDLEKPAKGKSAPKSKAKAKATPKSKTKAAAPPSQATGKRKASAEWDDSAWDDKAWGENWSGDWDADWGYDGHWEKPSKAKATTGKFSRSASKGRFKKLKVMKKMKKVKKVQKDGSTDPKDDATEYYGEGSSRAAAGRKASAASSAAGEAPSRRVRSKGAKSTEEPVEPEEKEPQECEPEAEDEEEVPTFARRYCGKRAYYRAKFCAIRDAYNDRVRVFLSNHSKMEETFTSACDAFWRYVAGEVKESPVEDADGWAATVRAMTYDFLIDDRVSKIWTSEGEDFFVQCPSKKKYEAKLRKYAADAAH
eukprot:s795_g10.t1